MEEYPECPICFDIYGTNQSHIRAPKVLSCGDTFCKECLEDIINRSNEDFILCPLCKQKIKKENIIDDYITNKEIIRLLNSSFNLPQNECKDEEGENKIISYNIVFLGNSAVGKSSIFQRISKDIFSDYYITTLGLDITTYFIKFRKRKYKLSFKDTVGQEQFRALTKTYLRQNDGVLFIYDLTDKRSFEDLEEWYDLYKNENEKVTGLLIGNKCDCERIVNEEEAKKFANEHGLKYLETSARLDKNIKKAIALLLEEIIESKALYNSISSVKTFSSLCTTNTILESKKLKKKKCAC